MTAEDLRTAQRVYCDANVLIYLIEKNSDFHGLVRGLLHDHGFDQTGSPARHGLRELLVELFRRTGFAGRHAHALCDIHPVDIGPGEIEH